VTHTDLTEVTRVIFIHEDAVVMLSSGVTATAGMLTVLSDTTVTAGDVAALFSCFVEAGGHLLLYLYKKKKVCGGICGSTEIQHATLETTIGFFFLILNFFFLQSHFSK